MTKIISIHSFRGGTGKSNTTANIAGLLAKAGKRVGVIDTDIQSPGIHIIFGVDGKSVDISLNDYLWRSIPIEQTAHDVTQNIGNNLPGTVYLIPSSTKSGEIARVLREGYDAQKLTMGFRDLAQTLNLDVLLIDTHPGLNEETLLSIVISHTLLIIMRPDKQDYEGTGIAIQVARELSVPKLNLLINKAPTILDPLALKLRVEHAYQCPVAAVIPHSDDLMNLASVGVFSLRYPNHPLTKQYKQVVATLMAS